MKSAVTIFFAAAFLCLLAACGENEKEKPKDLLPSAPQDPVLEKALDDMGLDKAKKFGKLARKAFTLLCEEKWEELWPLFDSKTQWSWDTEWRDGLKESDEKVKNLEQKIAEEENPSNKAALQSQLDAARRAKAQLASSKSALEFYASSMRRASKAKPPGALRTLIIADRLRFLSEEPSQDGRTGSLLMKSERTNEICTPFKFVVENDNGKSVWKFRLGDYFVPSPDEEKG
jgi:hypothetical protein